MLKNRILLKKIELILQTLLILILMEALFTLTGYIIFGPAGAVLAAITGFVLIIFSQRISSRLILKMYGVSKIRDSDIPGLYSITEKLAERGNLPSAPELFYIPSMVMNAFSFGSMERSAIALTDGLLRLLSWRELTGVLAHEISHIKNNDLWIMTLADAVSRLTSLLSKMGIFLLIFYFPIMLFAGIEIPFPLIFILFTAPTFSLLLQLSLSRTREYEADLGAVEITGDPRGLAAALAKIEKTPIKLWDLVFAPGRNIPDPSILRTHPDSEKRVKKLMELDERYDHSEEEGSLRGIMPDHFDRIEKKPRWRMTGLWH
jgi:heat shock protein HtpX